MMNIASGIGVCLHASSVNVGGRAVIFLGRSTSGKSTISRILKSTYPLIADDKVWVFKSEKGSWMVRDCTYSFIGNDFDPSNFGDCSYPLYFVVRIFKSDNDKVSLISQKESCKYLLDAVFEIEPQRKNSSIQQRKIWFGIVAEIAQNSKGCILTFKKSQNIVNVFREFFNENLYWRECSNEKIKV